MKINNGDYIIVSCLARDRIIIYSKSSFDTDYLVVADIKRGVKVLFEINNVETLNEKLDNVEYFRLLMAGDDYSEYTVYKAEAKLIGILSMDKVVEDYFYIAAPGMNLHKADIKDIETVMDIGKKEGRIKVGHHAKDAKISVYLDFDKLFLTHCSVLGRTGSGKTYFIQNLLKRIKNNYLVISSTGEYDSLADTDNIIDSKSITVNFYQLKNVLELNQSEAHFLDEFEKSNVYNAKEKITSSKLSKMIWDHFSTNTSAQGHLFLELPKEKKPVSKFVQTLCDKLSQINITISWRKFDFNKFPYVINTQELSPRSEEIAIYSLIYALFEKQKKEYRDLENSHVNKKTVGHILLVLEEAHNYAPSIKSTICKDIIIKIAREGRKYGLHLIILSQRPRYIDQTLLSQCGTNIIFNLPNPVDIEYITNHSNYNNQNSLNTIQNLKTGVCLITSNTRESDVLCKIDYSLNNQIP